MRAALTISAKDLRQRVRDRSAFIFGILAPLGLALIFSTIFGGLDDGFDFRFGVVDEDGGPLAAAFVDDVLGGVEDGGFAEIQRFDDADAARTAVADGGLTAAFVIPAGFTGSVTSGGAASIDVVGNVDADIGSEVAASIAESFAAELRATQLSVVMVAGEHGDQADMAALVERAAGRAAPVALGEVEAATKQLDAVTYLSAGMAVFFLFFTVQFGITSLLEERREGTLQRLFAAPIPRVAVIAGKGLTSLALGAVSMTVLIVASALLIGAQWGNPLGVAVLTLAGIMSAVAMMAFVATIANTAEQAQVWQSIVAVILGALGGVFFPISQTSSLLSKLTLLTPHQWYMRGLAELAGGGGVGAVLPATLALLVFSAVGLSIAGLRLRGEMLA